ncbi:MULTISPECIES: hypothetical protein [unclassified Brevundimonas]|uniref:hypothetical protein n=1 Tax=unclassified Brevundimonas TaxID=2622653 RepID=UPI000E8051A1|nr:MULTISPECIES: hypothetical protein [unclassified Brevundimonas]MCK6104527.1 hypothetical protein [Brevundimonas sp. EYE_349]HBI20653.1 hypothetical protein [Brevundimonas sp.]
MTRSQADNWSTAKSLAFLAAVFALVIGALLPFAALAAVQPGHPLVICSAEGPQTIQSGGMDGPINKHVGAKCAACVTPPVAALPCPPAPQPATIIRTVETVVYAPVSVGAPPPARAPPRPPSTAPPHP